MYRLFSSTIKQRRKELGLDQCEIAGRLGISSAAYSKYENGKSLPSNKVIAKLEEAFELLPHEFIKLRDTITSEALGHRLKERKESGYKAALGTYIVRKRIAAGLNHQQLADACGFVRCTISSYELARIVPSIDATRKIKDALKLNEYQFNEMLELREKDLEYRKQRLQLKDAEKLDQTDALSVMLSLARTLKKGRKTLGLTQQDVSKWIGVGPSMIGNYENARARPSLKVLLRYYEFFLDRHEAMVSDTLLDLIVVMHGKPNNTNVSSLLVDLLDIRGTQYDLLELLKRNFSKLTDEQANRIMNILKGVW